jgi:hypothetical protein
LLQLIFRSIMFLVGVVVLLDLGLPVRSESLHVDGHSTSVDYNRDRTYGRSSTSTNYKLHLIDGHIASCAVGYSAYNKLKDGDSVDVKATRIFRSCIRVTRGDEVIEDSPHRKIFGLIMGLFLIIAAIWWKPDEDTFSIRLF